MFERYTEIARRTIFFARYEASQLYTAWIEPRHLLLGLLREDPLLRGMLAFADREAIREEVARDFRGTASVSTSVDLPLSPASRQVLDRAREAADELGHRPIDCGHLLLGLLRLGDPAVTELLRRHGVEEAEVRRRLAPGAPPAAPKPAADLFSLARARTGLALEQISEAAAAQRLKRLPWTRKQALGHLIDWAAAHHEWIGRALVEPKVVAHGYPLEERVEAAKYNDVSWTDLVLVWLSLNDLVGHIASSVPPNRLQTPCRIGIEAEKPVALVIERYREYTTDVLAQICSLGDVLP